MTPDQENFDRLRRFLALKRYEQPPPGYFHHFSQHVIIRIRNGETGEPAGLFERWFGDARWLSRVFGSWQERPAFAGALGLAVCGLMLAGIFYSEPENSPVTWAPTTVFQLGSAPDRLAYQPLGSAELTSTNGMLVRQLRDSLFRPTVQFANSLAPAR